MPIQALKIGAACGLLLVLKNIIFEFKEVFKYSLSDGLFDVLFGGTIFSVFFFVISCAVIGARIGFKYKPLAPRELTHLSEEDRVTYLKKMHRMYWEILLIPAACICLVVMFRGSIYAMISPLLLVIMLAVMFINIFRLRKLNIKYKIPNVGCGGDSFSSLTANNSWSSSSSDPFRDNNPTYPGTAAYRARSMRN